MPNPCVDTDEPLVGATVYLYGSRGALVDEGTTDEDGYYEFTGLPHGRYYVEVETIECPSFAPSSHPTESSSPSSAPSVSSQPSTLHSSSPSLLPSMVVSILNNIYVFTCSS